MCRGVECKEVGGTGGIVTKLLGNLYIFRTLLPGKPNLLEISLLCNFFSKTQYVSRVVSHSTPNCDTAKINISSILLITVLAHVFSTFSAHPGFSCIGPSWAAFEVGHKGTKSSRALCWAWHRSLQPRTQWRGFCHHSCVLRIRCEGTDTATAVSAANEQACLGLTL